MTERQVVLITGGSRGIGRALAKGAAGAGYDVVITSRSSGDDVDDVIADLRRHGGRVEALAADIGAADSARYLVGQTLARMGRLDCLVNNTGVGEPIELAKLGLEHFENTLRVDLTGAFLMAQAAWPHMTERGGRLVFLSSGAARTGGVISAAYAASKGRVESMMQS